MEKQGWRIVWWNKTETASGESVTLIAIFSFCAKYSLYCLDGAGLSHFEFFSGGG